MEPSYLVTGGAGFIGTNFVRYLLRETSAKIVVLDKLTYAGNLLSLSGVVDDPRLTFVQADIADRAVLDSLFRTHQFTAVVNFAAETHVDRSIEGPRAFVNTNVVGAFELLEASRQFLRTASPDQKAAFRFLHVSTDEVYGSLGETGMFHETTPYAPNSPYAATKAAADHLVRAYYETFGLPAIVTNCSNNYGPYQFPEKLIPLLTLNALEGKNLPIYGDGGNIRDWLFVDDHCSGILLALTKGRPGEKYNIGGENERTNLQIVDALCKVLEKLRPAASNEAMKRAGKASYQDLKTFVADRPGHDRRYAIDASKIRSELGWKPKHNFDAGIELTIRWYVENRAWCDGVQAGKNARERLGLTESQGRTA